MKFTEKQLHEFAAPISDSEDQQCLNSIKMIRDALAPLGFSDEGRTIAPLYEGTSAYSLRMINKSTNRDIKFFVQGSYANNTNIKTQSDVDVAIVQEDMFYLNFRQGITKANYGIPDAPQSQITFKAEVYTYLYAKFGADTERKNKSIRIRGNSYRKDADTVPCTRYKDYSRDTRNDISNYIGGIYIITDDNKVIINYPEQHILNGRQKNNSTNYYYKKMVRVAKHIRNKMVDSSILSAFAIHSFGIESLLWNIPDKEYTKYINYRFIFDDLVQYLYQNLALLPTFLEANGIKLLCPTESDVSTYRQFIKDLTSFYKYDINEV